MGLQKRAFAKIIKIDSPNFDYIVIDYFLLVKKDFPLNEVVIENVQFHPSEEINRQIIKEIEEYVILDGDYKIKMEVINTFFDGLEKMHQLRWEEKQHSWNIKISIAIGILTVTISFLGTIGFQLWNKFMDIVKIISNKWWFHVISSLIIFILSMQISKYLLLRKHERDFLKSMEVLLNTRIKLLSYAKYFPIIRIRWKDGAETIHSLVKMNE